MDRADRRWTRLNSCAAVWYTMPCTNSREGYIDRDTARPIADALLKKLCIEDGMAPFAADLVYEAVRHFAAAAASPKDEPCVITSPRGCVS